jgi:hypothetical protein
LITLILRLLILILILIIGRLIFQNGSLKIFCPFCKYTMKLRQINRLNSPVSFKRKPGHCPNCNELIIQDRYSSIIFIVGFISIFAAFFLDTLISLDKVLFYVLSKTGSISLIFYFSIFNYQKVHGNNNNH